MAEAEQRHGEAVLAPAFLTAAELALEAPEELTEVSQVGVVRVCVRVLPVHFAPQLLGCKRPANHAALPCAVTCPLRARWLDLLCTQLSFTVQAWPSPLHTLMQCALSRACACVCAPSPLHPAWLQGRAPDNEPALSHGDTACGHRAEPRQHVAPHLRVPALLPRLLLRE